MCAKINLILRGLSARTRYAPEQAPEDCQSRGALQSTALEIGERLAGQQSSNSCSVGPCFFISKAYAKAYDVKAKEAQLVKGVGVSAKKLEDGTYCFVLTLDLLA